MILPGSYANGFAPRDGQPLHPALWRGCVGAWAPCLGPTGLTLRDWSGFARHGSLSTVLMQGIDTRPALVTTLSTQFVTVPLSAAPSGANSRSVSMWVRCSQNARQGFIGNREPAGFTGWFFGQLTSTSIWTASIGVGTASATVPSMLNRLAHVGFTHNTATGAVVFYCDGIQVGAATLATGTQSTASAAYLFREQENTATETLIGSILEARTYSRVLTASEMRMLGQRPGIAYEMAPRRRSQAQVTVAPLRYNLFSGSIGNTDVIGAS